MFSSPGFSCFSGLVSIPTADTVPMGQYSIEYQSDEQLSGYGNGNHIVNMQFGLNDRIETGIDLDISRDVNAGARPAFNIKYAVDFDKRKQTRLAIGICSVSPFFSSVPYMVWSSRSKHLCMHGGVIDTGSRGVFLAGIDHNLSGSLTIMADYTAGRENYSSVGLNYRLDDQFSVMAGVLIPNSHGDSALTVHFVIGGNFRKMEGMN